MSALSYKLTSTEHAAIRDGCTGCAWPASRLKQISVITIRRLFRIVRDHKNGLVLCVAFKSGRLLPTVVSAFEAAQMLAACMNVFTELQFLNETDGQGELPEPGKTLAFIATHATSGEAARLCSSLHDALRNYGPVTDEFASLQRVKAFWAQHGQRMEWLNGQRRKAVAFE